MLDDDDGAALVGELAEERQETERGRRIEIGKRFVDDVDRRLHHQDPGGRDQLALAAGQSRGLAPGEIGDAGPIHDAANASHDLGPRDPEVLGAERELRLDGRAHDLLGRILKDGADGPCDLPELQPGRLLAGDTDDALEVARIGMRDQAVDCSDEGALAAPGRTRHEDHLAVIDGQRQVDDRGLRGTPVAEGQPVDGDERLGHRLLPNIAAAAKPGAGARSSFPDSGITAQRR